MNITPVIKSVVNNQKVMKFASDPVWPVAGLIVSNAVFRPLFTLADPKASPEAKKYSAAREFFHQVLCLGAHFTLAETFKKIGFALGKKFVGNKPGTGFAELKNYKGVQDFVKNGGKLLTKYPVVNGSIAAGSILGAILALAVIAPKLNNWLLPPLLNKLGIKLEDEKKPESPAGIYAKKLNDGSLLNRPVGQLPRNFTAKQLQTVMFDKMV
jgi:hypothetical protein